MRLQIRLRKSREKKKPGDQAQREEPTAAPSIPQPGAMFRDVYPIIRTERVAVYAAIKRDPATGKLQYQVVEPALDTREQKQLQKLREILFSELSGDEKAQSPAERENLLREKAHELVRRYRIKLASETLDKLVYYLVRDSIYLSKLEPLLRDPLIEDISCDGPGIPLYVWHRQFESMPTNVVLSQEELDRLVVRLAYLAGRHISVAQPIVDGSLPDGTRVNLTFGSEVTRRGATFTLRRFRAEPFTIIDLIKFGTLSPEVAAYLWFLVERKASIMAVGGVATGKTTFINALAMFIPPEMKIVSIEDTPELNLPHENWIQAISRPAFSGTGLGEITLFDLLKASLRQRPDYIIVGEVRGAEAYTLFQALSTGHGGLSSLHADSIQSAIHRLESEPMNIPRALLPSLTAMVLLARTTVKEVPARRALTCAEIVGVDPERGELLYNTLYRWNQAEDTFVPSGFSPYIRRVAALGGLTEATVKEELQNRTMVLSWMAKEDVRSYNEVAKLIREFYADRERLFSRARLATYG